MRFEHWSLYTCLIQVRKCNPHAQSQVKKIKLNKGQFLFIFYKLWIFFQLSISFLTFLVCPWWQACVCMCWGESSPYIPLTVFLCSPPCIHIYPCWCTYTFYLLLAGLDSSRRLLESRVLKGTFRGRSQPFQGYSQSFRVNPWAEFKYSRLGFLKVGKYGLSFFCGVRLSCWYFVGADIWQATVCGSTIEHCQLHWLPGNRVV